MTDSEIKTTDALIPGSTGSRHDFIDLSEYGRWSTSKHEKWFYEDKLRNTIRRDLLLDYLAVHGTRLGYRPDMVQYDHFDPRMEFSSFIQAQRIPFMNRVLNALIKRLQDKFPQGPPLAISNTWDLTTLPTHLASRWMVDIRAPQDSDSSNSSHSRSSNSSMSFDPQYFASTKLAMIIGIPIIVSPVLLVPEKNWACAPDYLVRSDVLPYLFTRFDDLHVMPSIHMGARKVGLINCHYVTVQARFLSLHFMGQEGVNLFTLQNVGNVLLYKMISYYQNVVLERVQGYRSEWAFLIGRSCQWSKPEYELEQEIEDVGETEEAEDMNDPDNVNQSLDKSLELSSNDLDVRMNETDISIQRPKVLDALYTAGHIYCKEIERDGSNKQLIEKCIQKHSESVGQSIEWWNFLYSRESFQVTLTGDRPSDARLYPNMKNMESFPWQNTKKTLAKQYHEITQLWMAGVNYRDTCFRYHLYHLQDPQAVSTMIRIFQDAHARTRKKPKKKKKEEGQGSHESLEIESLNDSSHELIDITIPAPLSKRLKTMIQLVEINQKDQSSMISNSISSITHNTRMSPSYRPDKIQNRLFNWATRRKVTFYFDFETTESLYDSFSEFPFKSSQSFIAMIGSVIQHPITKEYEYRCFSVDHLTSAEELRILQEWFEYCRQTCELHNVDIQDEKEVAFVHWSQAEKKFLWTNRQSAANRHCPESRTWPTLPFIDMMQVIQEEPFCIQGCYNFKLKHFTKAMKKQGFATVDWPSSQCDSGLNAMTALFLCDRDAIEKGITMMEIPLMKEIVAYNRIDCISMAENVEWLISQVEN
ncbi:MAG: hypothetical protein Sylvanvirus1_63 [Sylvanvirus sp.]|uniref:Uncharacterized protein n=1 Tax=Sylvanvirus sp. TaxID=2487774 RepID=A0A3G5AGZ9_9VIRU|nr:MAG: hypothetical protein Sylvanvirus1_63 [Sylvanvirus sp.]